MLPPRLLCDESHRCRAVGVEADAEAHPLRCPKLRVPRGLRGRDNGALAAP